MEALLAYDPARLRALALRTAAAIQWLDARNSTEPIAQDAVGTLRLISHTLSTSWMPWFGSTLDDTSMTGWDSDGPAAAGPAAQGFVGASRAVSGAANPEQIAGDMVDLAGAVERKEPGALAALSEMIGEHGDDPAVMSAFARQMGPEPFQAFVVLLVGGDIYPIGFVTPDNVAARDRILAVLLPTPLQLDTDPDFDLSEAVSLGGDGTISWDDAINPGCVTFPGGSYGGGGFVTGPDGRGYPIVIPAVPADTGVYTADIGPVTAGAPCVGNLNGDDDGWEPIAYQSGIVRFQDAPNWAEAMLGFLAGTTGVVTPLPPSSGLQFIQMRPNSMPALATTPTSSTSPIGSPDPGLTDLVEVPNAQAGLDLAVRGSDGWVFATNMDNQRERAYQVIYEQNEDGRIRARIQTFTLAQDSIGDVVIVPEDVWVNGEGELMSQLTTFAPADGAAGVLSNVADVALTPGTTPNPYEIPQAVFP